MRELCGIIGVAAVAAAAVSGCAPKAPALRIASSTALHSLSEALADGFATNRPGVRAAVDRMDSASVAEAVRSGVVDVGIADYAPLPDSAVHVACIARDGIAVIAHPANTVTNLSLVALCDLFGGRATNWTQVGGRDHAVHLVVREVGSGTRHAFEDSVGATTGRANVVVQDTSGSLLATVANDENAVGYISHALVDARVRQVPLAGQSCTVGAIADGRYPLVRPILLLTRGTQPSEPVARFLDFLASAEGSQAIRTHGFVPEP